MNNLVRLILPTIIAATLSTNAAAQHNSDCADIKGTPPGLYVTTDEGRVFVVKDDKLVELAPGDSAYANESSLTCIKQMPEFLDWPCSTDAAQSRKFATYKIEDIDADNILKEVVRRYFEVPEVIEPMPEWLEGESNLSVDYAEIVQYSSPEFWYKINAPEDIVNPKRPKSLLIALFVGTNQVVIDNSTIASLREAYPGQPIPVVFVFNDSNTVPISYFGDNVSMEEIQLAFNERRIKLAEVPMWQLGDYHFTPTAEEFEKLVKMPEIEDIDAKRVEAIKAALETYAFSKKPMFVTMMEGGDKVYVDDPERLRVAISMGFDLIPTVVNFVEQDSVMARCGPGTPVGSGGVSGGSTPIGGATLPPSGGNSPPPGEPPSPAPPEEPASPSG